MKNQIDSTLQHINVVHHSLSISRREQLYNYIAFQEHTPHYNTLILYNNWTPFPLNLHSRREEKNCIIILLFNANLNNPHADKIHVTKDAYTLTSLWSQVQVFDLIVYPKLIYIIEAQEEEGCPQKYYLVKTSIGR